MPVLVRIEADFSPVMRLLEQLGEANRAKATARALNRTADSTKTHAVRRVAADLDIAQRRIRENIYVTRARPDRLVATVEARPGGAGVGTFQSKKAAQGRIPLLEFHARARKRGGVSYRLPTGRGLAPQGFIAMMASGHVGVFKRIPGTQMERSKWLRHSLRLGRDMKRQKIMELFGPSIPHSLSSPAILEAVKATAGETLQKNLLHELEYLLSQQGGGTADGGA